MKIKSKFLASVLAVCCIGGIGANAMANVIEVEPLLPIRNEGGLINVYVMNTDVNVLIELHTQEGIDTYYDCALSANGILPTVFRLDGLGLKTDGGPCYTVTFTVGDKEYTEDGIRIANPSYYSAGDYSYFTANYKIVITDKPLGDTLKEIDPTSGNITLTFSSDTGVFGDVNGDGVVDASDASEMLAHYALISIGEEGSIPEENFSRVDVTKDAVLDAADASLILRYYTMSSTGQIPNWEIEE